MSKNPFAPDYKALPEILPLFPLSGVLLLPGGTLPLNIFEPRYIAMVETALSGNRMIGMIQPQKTGNQTLYKTGCAGKITEFKETCDGRYILGLTGICRFDIKRELPLHNGFRRIQPCWHAYEEDLKTKECLGMDRIKLRKLLETYFEKEALSCDWQAIERADDNHLITCLSMACPLEPQEKQALLESTCCAARARMFITLLEMAIQEKGLTPTAH